MEERIRSEELKPKANLVDEICWEGKFLRVGRTGRWEWVQRIGCTTSVNIVPLTCDDQLVLIEQYRHPVARRVVEWPAGLVGDTVSERTESVLDAAKRELLEECGYTAQSWIDCGEFPSSAGLTDECNHIVLALGATRIATGGGVKGEKITSYLVPRPQIDVFLEQRIATGAIVTPHLHAGLRLLERSRHRH